MRSETRITIIALCMLSHSFYIASNEPKVTGYGDNEKEAFEWAKDWALRVGKADDCKPLQATFVSRLDEN